jgi:hypothetical protein
MSDDFEAQMMQRTGVSEPLTVKSLAGRILELSQDPEFIKAFAGGQGIEVLRQEDKRFASLSPKKQQDMFEEAKESLDAMPMPQVGRKPMGSDFFGTALGIAGMTADVVRDPSKIVGIGQSLFGSHPNAPTNRGSGSSLVGSQYIPKIIRKVDELETRVKGLEGPAPAEGVALPTESTSPPPPEMSN